LSHTNLVVLKAGRLPLDDAMDDGRPIATPAGETGQRRDRRSHRASGLSRRARQADYGRVAPLPSEDAMESLLTGIDIGRSRAAADLEVGVA
jgi:hypothetical protein